MLSAKDSRDRIGLSQRIIVSVDKVSTDVRIRLDPAAHIRVSYSGKEEGILVQAYYTQG